MQKLTDSTIADIDAAASAKEKSGPVKPVAATDLAPAASRQYCRVTSPSSWTAIAAGERHLPRLEGHRRGRGGSPGRRAARAMGTRR